MFMPSPPKAIGLAFLLVASIIFQAVPIRGTAVASAAELRRGKSDSENKPGASELFVEPTAVAGLTATKSDAFPSHPSGQAEPGDTITYTVDVNNPTAFDATGVAFND